MSARNGEKGKEAELEVVHLLRDLTGWDVRRRLQEGRWDDAGDLEGVPSCCVQVKWWAVPAEAEAAALRELPEQVKRARCPFGAAFIRHRGGRYVVAMTPELFVALLREATAP